MRYLCLLVGEPDMEVPVPGTPEFMQMLSDYESATQAMAADGVLVDGGPLQPPSSATTLRMRGGEPLVTDGPFAELKEQIGGYYVLDCADLDEALRRVAGRIDVGLILPDVPAGGRLEPAGSFNALFTHRVPGDVGGRSRRHPGRMARRRVRQRGLRPTAAVTGSGTCHVPDSQTKLQGGSSIRPALMSSCPLLECTCTGS
jgi:hypothetical protein